MRSTSERRTPASGVTPARSPLDASEVEAILHAREAQRRGIRSTDELLRIVLLDDQPLLRCAFKALLSQHKRIDFVGDAGTLAECLTMAEQHTAHLVMLNVDMRHADGLECIRTITHTAGAPHVLALGNTEDPSHLLAIYRAGASGFLASYASVQELYDAVETVAGGGVYVGTSTTRAIASGLRSSATDGTRNSALARLGQLSDRERTVLRLVARGYSGPEIAQQLHITTKTVDTYRHRIHEKIGLHHRSEYVTLALAADLLTD